MKIQFLYTEEFLKEAKLLSKHYPSFKDDLKNFCKEYSNNPDIGTDLGQGVRKIRMAIASKGKGKSGGARVITFTIYVDQENSKIYMTYIYDKSSRESIQKKRNTCHPQKERNNIDLPAYSDSRPSTSIQP